MKDEIINQTEEVKEVESYFNVRYKGVEYEVYCSSKPEEYMTEDEWEISPSKSDDSISEDLRGEIIDFIENNRD